MNRVELVRAMGKISTARLQGRLRRILRDLARETRPEEMEKLRDEERAVRDVLEDRGD